MSLAATAVPTPADLGRWLAADMLERPARLDRLRTQMAEAHVDAYFGVRSEDSRYVTGFSLRAGEDRVAGVSGHFLVSADETVVLADSRYRAQAIDECPGSRIEDVYNDLSGRWPALLSSLRPISAGRDGRVARVAVEASAVSQTTWSQLAAAALDVELVPAGDPIAELRAVKEPAEIERIGAACAVADAALERLLPSIRPGDTEHDLALALEWEMRTHGAEAVAFDVACLTGPRAALPHGAPGERRVAAGEVLLFDFGAQVCGYRSDMTRTLFVGEPDVRDLGLYELVARAQEAAFEVLLGAVATGDAPLNRVVDAAARDVITGAGLGDRFGHGLGHGIGLATHEAPSLGRLSPERALPSPTVFSIEPGVYLDGETGVRIEDLVAFDVVAGRCERLTRFDRGVVVVGS